MWKPVLRSDIAGSRDLARPAPPDGNLWSYAPIRTIATHADIALIARFTDASPIPVNIMIGDATPSVRALALHGVARVSHGPRPYLLAINTLEQAARTTLSWGA